MILIIVLSLSSGLGLAGFVLIAPFVPTTADALTGAMLLAFGLGWAMLAILSVRFTAEPQVWALVPAAFLGMAACVAVGGSSLVHGVFGWVWPLLLAGIVAWTLATVPRRLSSRLGRCLVYPVIATLGLAAVGGGYVAVSEALHAGAGVRPGSLVDIGGHRLHLHCTGTGRPTVVLEPGLSGSSAEVARIAATVAPDTTVCVYDRAGRGWSDDTGDAQDAVHVAADLHTLLDRADVPGPYVLAGHSFGGLYALSFAAQFPDEVAGMVLLDSTAPSSDRPYLAPDRMDVVGRIATVMPSIGRLGLGRELAGSVREFLHGSASTRQAGALTDLHDKPLVVVTADSGHDAGWMSAQRHLTTLSTNSLQHIARDTTHQSLVEDPTDSAAASQAVREVVRAVRTSQPLNVR